MVFPENQKEAEARTSMLASLVTHETNENEMKWFCNEALDKIGQVSWDDEGGFIAQDDDVTSEIEMTNFQVVNVESVENLS